VAFTRAEPVMHDAVDVREEVRVREANALRLRGRAARELEERDVVRCDVDRAQRLLRLAHEIHRHDLLELRTRRLNGAEQPLDPRIRDERARAGFFDDVPRIVEIALELAETERRIDGNGDDPGTDRAQ